jgi:hypothetical protein
VRPLGSWRRIHPTSSPLVPPPSPSVRSHAHSVRESEGEAEMISDAEAPSAASVAPVELVDDEVEDKKPALTQDEDRGACGAGAQSSSGAPDHHADCRPVAPTWSIAGSDK